MLEKDARVPGPALPRPDAIPPVNETVRAAACRRLNVLTKPLGALGWLEPLAAQICAIQGTLEVRIAHPAGIVFAADHGVSQSGVSAYPREVTAQMVANFLHGGAAISVLAKLQGMELWIVDAGVEGDCGAHPRFIDAKIRRGTRNFVDEAAMTPEECTTALRWGRDVLDRVIPQGGNTLVLGEMGIGNTAASAMLMHGLTGKELERLRRARHRRRRSRTGPQESRVGAGTQTPNGAPAPIGSAGRIRRL